MDRRERFYKIYSNLPLGVRKEVVLALEDKRPISWQVAYLEIDQKTSLGEDILERLEELKII